MIDSSGPLGGTVKWLLLSAALHLLVFLVAGFNSTVYWVMAWGLVNLLYAVLLANNWRALAYVVYLLLMSEAVVLIGLFYAASGLAAAWYVVMFVANLVATLKLLAALWRDKA